MSDELAQDAAADAVDEDRLLEGENPTTPYLEDAIHWISVYEELLGVKRDLLAVAEVRLPEMIPEARQEVAATDLVVLDSEMRRFSRRLAYWQQRCIDLGRPTQT